MIYILQQDTPDAKAGAKYYLVDGVYVHEDVYGNPAKIMVSYPATIVENNPDFFLPETARIIEIKTIDTYYTFIANTGEQFHKSNSELYTLLKS